MSLFVGIVLVVGVVTQLDDVQLWWIGSITLAQCVIRMVTKIVGVLLYWAAIAAGTTHSR